MHGSVVVTLNDYIKTKIFYFFYLLSKVSFTPNSSINLSFTRDIQF